MSSKVKYSNKSKQVIYTVIILLSISTMFVWEGVLSFQKHSLRIDFLDVGQGDATLITTEDNLQVLVDTGPGKNILSELPLVMPLLDRSIDIVIITHPDKDHLEGLRELVESYSIETVIINKVNSESSLYKEILQKLKDHNIKTLSIDEHTDIRLGYVTIDVIWPNTDTDLYLIGEINNTSFGMIVSYKEFNALFTGDLYSEYEVELIEAIETYGEIEVYKVGHHGSRTSSSNLLLSELHSTIAVISAGEHNSYGHPHQETLDRLESQKLDVFRTDLNGRITLIVKDSGYSMISEEGPVKEYTY